MKRLTTMGFILTACLVITGSAQAQNPLMEILINGPIAQVHRDGHGKFKDAMGIALINAPADVVFSTFIDFERFVDFMPQVVEVDVKKRTAEFTDVEFEIEVPGPNYEYTMRHTMDREKGTLLAQWQDGDIEGAWSGYEVKKIEGDPNRCLIKYTGKTELPSIIQSLEDDQQALTIGVNASTVLGVVTAIKKEAEKRHKASPAK